jgi:hypothetical protein
MCSGDVDTMRLFVCLERQRLSLYTGAGWQPFGSATVDSKPSQMKANKSL